VKFINIINKFLVKYFMFFVNIVTWHSTVM